MIVIVIIVIVLLISSGSNSEKNSLRDYSSHVYRLISNSNSVGTKLFSDLEGARSNGESTVETDLLALHQQARQQYQEAQDLSVPSAMQNAQSHLLTTMRLRYDGVGVIASHIQQALGSDSTSKDAVQEMAAGTARFYASDVIYKGYVAPEMAIALNSAGVDAGNNEINSGQFLHDLGWLQTTFVGVKIGAHLPATAANSAPVPGGLYGHTLNSVAVGSNTMVEGVTNHVAASPAPTFTLSLTNGGHYTEFDVVCRVSVQGVNDSATSTIAETHPGQNATCDVQLPSPPPSGPFHVTATVEKVPGEKNVANNTQHFVVDFTG